MCRSRATRWPLAIGALLYVWATTSYGLLIATMTSSQVAATFATAIASVVPTIQFSGPAAAGVIAGRRCADNRIALAVILFPAPECRCAFTKGLGWDALAPDHSRASLFRTGADVDRCPVTASAGEIDAAVVLHILAWPERDDEPAPRLGDDGAAGSGHSPWRR